MAFEEEAEDMTIGVIKDFGAMFDVGGGGDVFLGSMERSPMSNQYMIKAIARMETDVQALTQLNFSNLPDAFKMPIGFTQDDASSLNFRTNDQIFNNMVFKYWIEDIWRQQLVSKRLRGWDFGSMMLHGLESKHDVITTYHAHKDFELGNELYNKAKNGFWSKIINYESPNYDDLQDMAEKLRFYDVYIALKTQFITWCFKTEYIIGYKTKNDIPLTIFNNKFNFYKPVDFLVSDTRFYEKENYSLWGWEEASFGDVWRQEYTPPINSTPFDNKPNPNVHHRILKEIYSIFPKDIPTNSGATGRRVQHENKTYTFSDRENADLEKQKSMYDANIPTNAVYTVGIAYFPSFKPKQEVINFYMKHGEMLNDFLTPPKEAKEKIILIEKDRYAFIQKRAGVYTEPPPQNANEFKKENDLLYEQFVSIKSQYEIGGASYDRTNELNIYYSNLFNVLLRFIESKKKFDDNYENGIYPTNDELITLNSGLNNRQQEANAFDKYFKQHFKPERFNKIIRSLKTMSNECMILKNYYQSKKNKFPNLEKEINKTIDYCEYAINESRKKITEINDLIDFNDDIYNEYYYFLIGYVAKKQEFLVLEDLTVEEIKNYDDQIKEQERKEQEKIEQEKIRAERQEQQDAEEKEKRKRWEGDQHPYKYALNSVWYAKGTNKQNKIIDRRLDGFRDPQEEYLFIGDSINEVNGIWFNTFDDDYFFNQLTLESAKTLPNWFEMNSILHEIGQMDSIFLNMANNSFELGNLYQQYTNFKTEVGNQENWRIENKEKYENKLKEFENNFNELNDKEIEIEKKEIDKEKNYDDKLSFINKIIMLKEPPTRVIIDRLENDEDFGVFYHNKDNTINGKGSKKSFDWSVIYDDFEDIQQINNNELIPKQYDNDGVVITRKTAPPIAVEDDPKTNFGIQSMEQQKLYARRLMKDNQQKDLISITTLKDDQMKMIVVVGGLLILMNI